MVVNFVLAVVLTGIVTYTDIKSMKIYNAHVVLFFGLGLISLLAQRQYSLLISAALILALYLFFYAGGGIMSNIALNFGLMPIPEGQSPIGGGDVKLAAALALLLGHYPVLYGTLVGVLFLVLWSGLRLWKQTGCAQSVVDLALGRAHAAPAPFGPFLGVCSLCAAMLI